MDVIEVDLGRGERARVARFTRGEFHERFEYHAGEHMTFIGKTQSGKTTLAFELLDEVTTPDLPAVVLVMKPKDPTPAKWARRLGYRRVRTWPPANGHLPAWAPQDVRPRGWVLWPKLGDINADSGTLIDQFHTCLAENYAQAARRRGRPRIVFADEVVGITKLRVPGITSPLPDDLDAYWMRGSGMGVALWAACQRPFHAPLNAYEQSAHLFLWRSTDARNVKRYSEIGGVNPALVHKVTSSLSGRDCFYIRRTDYRVCVVAES